MRRSVSILMMVVLLFSALVFPTAPASAETQAELKEKINEIDEQIAANKQKINELKEQKEAQQQMLDALNSQITATQEKVDTVTAQVEGVKEEIRGLNKQIKALKKEIDALNVQIDQTNAAINETKAEIEQSKDELSRKLKASYMTGNQSTLKIMMGADTLASFLTHLEMMKRTSENDRDAIEGFRALVLELREKRNLLNEQKAEVDAKKTEVEAVRAQTLEKKAELESRQQELQTAIRSLEKSYSETRSYLSELDQTSAAYTNYIKNLEKERAEADAEIERQIRAYQAQHSSSGSSSGGQMTTGQTYTSNDTWLWPLGGASCYISSGFGNRSASISGWSFHGGIDITGGGIYGKPVYASRAGTVVTAVWGTTGYGRYVIIDHGDGFSTVYGHCSNLTVSQGQSVSKGQQIANVGSTGNSTGPHLHFEVRYNGEKQNPLNYVSH